MWVRAHGHREAFSLDAVIESMILVAMPVRYDVEVMAWDVETQQEVTDWYLELSGDERDVVAAHIDLLAGFGHLLRMPHARSLGQGLIELCFDMSRRSWRITYWHQPNGVIVLPTEFRKQRNNETSEIARARRASTPVSPSETLARRQGCRKPSWRHASGLPSQRCRASKRVGRT